MIGVGVAIWLLRYWYFSAFAAPIRRRLRVVAGHRPHHRPDSHPHPDQSIIARMTEPAESAPSIHDSLLTGYGVDGKTRTITLHTEPHQGGGEAFVDVIFAGVVAYQFEGDAMSNIIFGIELALPEYADEIAKMIVVVSRAIP